MPLQEVVILNPRRPAKRRAAKSKAASRKSSTKRKASTRTRKGGKTMARRRTTTKRRKTAARKTTTRRRAPARRRTTRRKSTTRRKASPATRRRKTTRRKSTTRRRKSPATRRRKTTRRKSTTRRRKSPARRKTTRRKSTTRRRKSPARRRKTTRRKSPARRKSTSRRRRTARRRSVSRRRSVAARKMKMPSLGGFTRYVKKHMDTAGIAMVLGGLALPTIAMNVYNRLNLGSYLNRLGPVSTVLTNPFGQAALGTVVSAAVTFGLASTGMIKESTALGMNMIALGVFAATAIARQFPTAGAYLPYNASIDGMHSMAGYRGGYLGYLGNVDVAEQLPAPVEDQLFGVGSGPSFNVF